MIDLIKLLVNYFLPDSIELYSLVIIRGEIRYKRQVRNLGGCPAKLENDHKWSKVDEFGPIRGVWITYAVIEEERVTASHGYCA